MNKRIVTMILLLPFLLSGTALMAQQGFGTNAPDLSSVVHMEANNKGLLIPRVELKATNVSAPVSSPAPYLLVFNTANITDKGVYNVTPGFYFWNTNTSPAGWVRLLDVGDLSAVSGWSMKGNAADATSFLGTDKNLVFKTGGVERMRITDYGSVGVGTATPSAAVGLELQSTSQGFLPPRMSEDQMNSILKVGLGAGFVVYNITRNCLACSTIDNAYYGTYKFKCFSDKLAAAKAAALNSTLPQKGSTFTYFYNGCIGSTPEYYSKPVADGGYGDEGYVITHKGGERFSDNTQCQNEIISAGGCGGASTVTGVSGRIYKLVEINKQCWMAENLAEVPPHTKNLPWKDDTDTGWYGWYDGTEYVDGAWRGGYLYQWSAAMDGATDARSRGACPVNFHIPSECEFQYLEHGLGMTIAAENGAGATSSYRDGSDTYPRIHRKLVVSPSCGVCTNASGFNAIYSGFRQPGGTFKGGKMQWWVSRQNGSEAYFREMVYDKGGGMAAYSNDKKYSMGVRCLKD